MNVETQVQYINVENIIPNRFQPRLTFDENALRDLASSIKEHGIIQPLVLRKLSEDKFEIIAGERRYKAAQIAGLENVPAIIANLDDNASAEVALVENLQRKDLSPIEKAKSYEKLLNRGNTQEELAKKMGVSQSSIANTIRLLNLEPETQDALMKEKISERHARSLLQIKDHDKQIEMLNKIINERLTVRQLDEQIKKMNDAPEMESFSLTEAIDNLPEMETFSIEDKPVLESENIEDSKEVVAIDETEDLQDAINDLDISKLIENAQKDLKNKYEIYDIPTAEEASNDDEKKEDINIDNSLKIENGNLDSVINAIKELEEKISQAGFKIDTEDYDFEDLYQIIIKIEK